eukprot:jgi/Bigna1/66151/fgenesh1_pg.1_\
MIIDDRTRADITAMPSLSPPSHEEIRKLVRSELMISRGVKYYNRKLVCDVSFDPQHTPNPQFTASCQGASLYLVSVCYDAQAQVRWVEPQCTCKTAFSRGGICKHLPAVMYQIRAVISKVRQEEKAGLKGERTKKTNPKSKKPTKDGITKTRTRIHQRQQQHEAATSQVGLNETRNTKEQPPSSSRRLPENARDCTESKLHCDSSKEGMEKGIFLCSSKQKHFYLRTSQYFNKNMEFVALIIVIFGLK